MFPIKMQFGIVSDERTLEHDELVRALQDLAAEGEGAAACAEALGVALNSVRGWQRDAFKGEIAPWQDGYTRSTPAEKTCPKCGKTEQEVTFGLRKMWRGGQLVLVRQSYCNKCR